MLKNQGETISMFIKNSKDYKCLYMVFLMITLLLYNSIKLKSLIYLYYLVIIENKDYHLFLKNLPYPIVPKDVE